MSGKELHIIAAQTKLFIVHTTLNKQYINVNIVTTWCTYHTSIFCW